MVECLLSMRKALGLIDSIRKRKMKEGGEEAREGEKKGGKGRG